MTLSLSRDSISLSLLLETAAVVSVLRHDSEYWTAFGRSLCIYCWPNNCVTILWQLLVFVMIGSHPKWTLSHALVVYVVFGLAFAYFRSLGSIHNYDKILECRTKIAPEVRSSTLESIKSLCSQNAHLRQKGLAAVLEKAVLDISTCGQTYRQIGSSLFKEISVYEIYKCQRDMSWKAWSAVLNDLCMYYIVGRSAESISELKAKFGIAAGSNGSFLSADDRESALSDIQLSLQLHAAIKQSPSILLFWWKRRLANELEQFLYASSRTRKQYQIGKWLMMACLYRQSDIYYDLERLLGGRRPVVLLPYTVPFGLWGVPPQAAAPRPVFTSPRPSRPLTSHPRTAGGGSNARIYDAATKRKSSSYTLTENMLKFNSYPRFVDEKQRGGVVSILGNSYDKKFKKKMFASDSDLMRECVRCKQSYSLGISSGSISCRYHLEGIDKTIHGNRVHSCCGQIVGCQSASCHVTSTIPSSELNCFVASPSPTPNRFDPRSKQVLALDCEMVFTKWGPALARLTAVDVDYRVVLDVIVRPPHEVIDYNTMFSGITKEMIDGARCSLQQAQQQLFSLMNSETILVGHSLESDLKAMRIVHDRVVDTAILFPRNDGAPKNQKRSLKDLSRELLGVSIQTAGSSGHDSKEDAVAAMRLFLHKLQMDNRLKD